VVSEFRFFLLGHDQGGPVGGKGGEEGLGDFG